MTAASRIAVATSALRKAEQGAVSDKPTENKSGGSLYTGSGRSKDDKGKNGKSQGKFKKRLTYLILSAVLGGGVAFLGSSNSLLAPALEILYTEATDTQYASNSMRYTRIMQYALSGQGSVSVSWSGKMRYGRMSTGFQNRLAKQGIDVIDTGSGRTLRYTHTDANGITTVKDIDADNFLRTYQNDVDFRDSYVTAKRGRVASFFDNVADRVYSHLGLSRNLFEKFRATGDSNTDVAQYRDTMSPRFDGNETTNTTTTADKKPKTDPDTGETIKNPDTGETEYEFFKEDSSSSGTSSSQAEAETKANGLLNSILGKVSGTVNAGCMVMQVGTMISTLVAANEIYQSINYFMGLTENISKMKAGYGDESAINEVLNFFSTSTTTEYTSFADEYITASGDCNSSDNIDGCVISLSDDAKGQETGTPLEANGVQMMLAYAPAKKTTNDRYSLERTGNAIVHALSSFGRTMIGCNIARITTSAISIVVSLTPAGLAKIAGNIMVNALVGTAVSFAASAFIGFLVPTIAKALFTNIFENVTGIPAGELYTRGAVASNTRLGRSGSGQSPSSESATLAYNQTTQEVLALDAEIDRKNHSPFDITNKNTFFGSIAYKFLLPLSTTSSVTNATSSIARSTSSAIASLVPGVSAASNSTSGSNYMTTFGQCAQLESIGAVGDIYCNPVVSTDTSTIDLDPDDTTYKSVVEKSLKDNNNGDGYEVIPNSRLDWYIRYCDGRDSPFGILDQNILSEISTSIPSGEVGILISSLPIIGDLMDIIDSVKNITNEEWATGAICVNSSTNTAWDTEIKYYQRYVEDMRILEQMGAFEEETTANDDKTTTIAAIQNPVSAAEDRYRAEYPINNSYAGYLSRISGLTINNVETVLALVEYYNYIENYNPDTRVALDEHELTNTTSTELIANLEHEDFRFKDSSLIKDSPEHTLATREYIIYADLRSRNYVA